MHSIEAIFNYGSTAFVPTKCLSSTRAKRGQQNQCSTMVMIFMAAATAYLPTTDVIYKFHFLEYYNSDRDKNLSE